MKKQEDRQINNKNYTKMVEIKFFNKWGIEGVSVEDAGLSRYITIQPRLIPKTGARYAGNRFHKSSTSVVERLAVKLMGSGHKSKKHVMSSGHNTGKKNGVLRVVEEALEIIEKTMKQNPIKVLVKAVEMGAPREEVIAIEYGGARYPKAVDVAPQRRVDLALRYITQGAYIKSFNKKTSVAQALAAELMNAAKGSLQSAAIAKKRDTERQASSSK